MDIQGTYNQVIDELKHMKRPQLILQASDIEFLKNSLENYSSLSASEINNSADELIQILCILDNSRTLSLEFREALVKIASMKIKDELLILILGVMRRHIIEASQKNGYRQGPDVLDLLKALLFHPNSEVVEWSLRLVESLGSQAIYFKETLKEIKPKITLFDSHKKACKEIITLIQGRWT